MCARRLRRTQRMSGHAQGFKEEEVGRESATTVLSGVDTHTVSIQPFVFVSDIHTSQRLVERLCCSLVVPRTRRALLSCVARDIAVRCAHRGAPRRALIQYCILFITSFCLVENFCAKFVKSFSAPIRDSSVQISYIKEIHSLLLLSWCAARGRRTYFEI